MPLFIDTSLPTDGYVAIRNWIPHPAVARLHEHVADLKRHGASRPKCARGPGNELVALRWNDPVVATILDDRAALDALRRAAGATSLRWISGYVSSIEPIGVPLAWHQDWWCWNHVVSQAAAAAQVAVLCYLADVDENGGALRVIPGSHRRRAQLHDQLGSLDNSLVYDADHPVFAEHPDQRTLSGQAGDAIVFDYRTLHGATANWSCAARDAVLLSFTPAWDALPGDIRSHLAGHFALPTAKERTAGGLHPLLPSLDGPSQALELSRVPRFSPGMAGT